MYTTENYLNAEIEYRVSKVRDTWSPRRRRQSDRDRVDASRPLPGERTHATR